MSQAENNPNRIALDEMAIAQQQLAAAYISFGLLMEQLQQSEQHFQNATEVSINREQACYQKVNAEVTAHYALLKLNAAALAQAFQMPIIRRIILAVQQQTAEIAQQN